MEKHADYGDKADGWFAALDDSIAPLGAVLPALIFDTVPGATESIKSGPRMMRIMDPFARYVWARPCVTLRSARAMTSEKEFSPHGASTSPRSHRIECLPLVSPAGGVEVPLPRPNNS